jgi:hypothetical protein
MKPPKVCTASLLLSLCFAGAAPALSAKPLASQCAPVATKSMPTPDEVVAKMDSKLSLSADQKAKITPIIADRQEKIKALQADTSTPRMQKMQSMKQIMSDSDMKIKAVLNDDQKKKYDEMQQEMHDKMQERRQQKQSAPPQN